MSTPTDIATESDPPAAPDVLVLVLAAEYFFVETVEIPAALAAAELADFAELSMESIAPFPLEQIRWGFLVAPDKQHILIYAALKERLERAGYRELERYVWVLPDFATLDGARFQQDTEVMLEGESYHTALCLPKGESLPANIRSLPLEEHTPDAQDSAARNVAHPSIRLKLCPVELSEKGTPVFQFETVGEAKVSGHWSPLEPAENTLWQADIRPANYKAAERSTRRTSALVTRAMGYAALFVLLLLLLEGLLWTGQTWLSARKTKIQTQSVPVRRIEDKQSLMNKLEQVAQNELRPIAILEAANQIRVNLGDTGIVYDETVIEDGNRLTIEGKANTINELNAYTESLRSSGNFQLIDSPKSITRSGKTTFNVTLDYIHSEPPQATAASSVPSASTAPAQESVASRKARREESKK